MGSFSNQLAQGFQVPTDPQVWIVIAGALATGYVFLKARRNSMKTPAKGPVPFSSLSAQRKVEQQMTELLVELEKMVRQMNAQLDTRAARLEELIRQADERIAELKSLEGGRSGGGGYIGSHSASQPPLGFTGQMGRPGRVEDIPEVPAPIPIDPRHAMVYRLADEGRSPVEIAREIGQPAGEVELILALRRRAR